MSLDPELIHAERYPRISEVIHNGIESIVREWLRRSRADQPGTCDTVADEALGRIRGFLQSLARQLVSTDSTALLPQRRATWLGELRWKQGEDISQVVRDYQILRLVLLVYLDKELDPPLTRDESMALSLNIDEAIDAAISAYSEQETRCRDEYAQELEESNQELRRFAHVVAHELKSPLNSQSLAIDLLRLQVGEENLDDNACRTLRTASEAIVQMTNLINELLRYAEIQAEEEEAALEPTDCGEVVTQVLENLKADILSSGADIRTGQLPTVLARPAGMSLLFQNLVRNAIHYRRNQPLRITIEASDSAEGWQFGVTDNGAGIRPEDQTRIFQMFARAHEALRPRGTGIGLAMCRRIVEKFGGRIWVESEPEVGSAFFFTLPKAEESAVQPADHDRAVPV